MRADELSEAVADRAAWRLDGPVGLYTPHGVWPARVRAVDQPERASRAWPAAVLQGGVARHSRYSGTAVDAVRWAERTVATSLVPQRDDP